MNAELLFTRLPSPASRIVHGPSSIVRPQPSNLPFFYSSIAELFLEKIKLAT